MFRSALQYHPDRHSSASEAEKAEAEKKFKEIGEAFDILSNPEKKASLNGPMSGEGAGGWGGGASNKDGSGGQEGRVRIGDTGERGQLGENQGLGFGSAGLRMRGGYGYGCCYCCHYACRYYMVLAVLLR